MNKKLILSIIMLACLAFQCTSEKEKANSEEVDAIGGMSEVDDIRNEVNSIHDEAMAKMNDIYRLKGVLKEAVANNPDQDNTALEQNITQLEIADKAMMDFMHNFKLQNDSIAAEIQMEYYESEKEKIQKVAEVMDKAIEEAEKVVPKVEE